MNDDEVMEKLGKPALEGIKALGGSKVGMVVRLFFLMQSLERLSKWPDCQGALKAARDIPKLAELLGENEDDTSMAAYMLSDILGRELLARSKPGEFN
jgi:hypothetical protein